MNIEDNKKLIMQGYQKFAAKDIAGILELQADDVEWIVTGPDYLPFAGIYRGKDQVGQFFRKMDESVETLHFEPREFIAEGEKVIVLGHGTWAPRSTGRRYESDWVHVFTVRNGKTVRYQAFSDPAQSAAAFATA